MRFVSFYRADGSVAPGFLRPDAAGDRIVDVTRAGNPAAASALPPSMLAWIEIGLQDVARRISAVSFPEAAFIALDRVRLAAPVARPGKIVGAAFNFHDALRERAMPAPASPVIFIKSGRTVVGPDDPVRLARDVGNVTYEAELGVVIGRMALRISPEEAMDYVAGYVALNDVSASDMVRADKAFVRGKNQPTFCPLGPWIATPDDMPDLRTLGIRLLLDGTARQSGTTADLVFGIAELIAYASTQMPLEPGDIIATGTPAGVAASHEPPAWLKPGSAMTTEVDGLGSMINPILAGEAP